MPLDVAVDTCVLGDLVDARLPKEKERERGPLKRMLKLHLNGVIAIRLVLSGTFIEVANAPEHIRNQMEEIAGDVVKRPWPTPVFSKSEDQDEFERKKKCVLEVIGKKYADDVGNLMLARYSGVAHYVTTDYDFYNCFNERRETIKDKCTFDALVVTPSEFMDMFDAGKV